MKEFGLIADFKNLDRELGMFGGESVSTAAEFVAENRGKVIGSVILARKDSESLKRCGFYVHATSRGCGAGRKLLECAIGFAKSSGYRRILLETWSDMKSALHLYRSLGWVPAQRLDPTSGAEWLYVLEWSIA
ncbi:GNAT family N-acetyltransferase [Klebsiella pneumoniae]|uniref:GNAT family N-acetyltransferase n=1 Tax=Aeromonas caviae TaxID=648 RepID=A0ABU5WCR9_AERCA|nr:MULTISPECIES: GNAT family N-acetyltransferase [Gammaproteobacteria]MCD6740311.1 GNAT family N-acetyltransferase [Escherichia coli]MCT9062300.1 GNAT family N-acetyltransferase [Klebsiella pneumoniae]MEA9424475.1 GNAT family N-acetyltransferase [Aeromonas caviae]MEA9429306.1 GNAT family N-acetyltransferase [Aeromonas caviae]MEA9438665.1 GNAT family N-acetyltransferase [Aeromonas caviae]